MPNYRRDFSPGATYFFTVVINQRSDGLLIKYINEFKQAYQDVVSYYPFETIALTVLPDHFHLIMQLPENDSDYSKRISSLKYNFSSLLPTYYRNMNLSRQFKREAGIWQRRFWEHLIRDDRDLDNHIDYVYYNPVKHGYVSQVMDWKYSTFHRDVKNGIFELDWGSYISESVRNLYLD